MKEKKYYTVWIGLTPGVYDNWTDCQLQIKGYVGAKFKSFPSKQEAEEAFSNDYNQYLNKKEIKEKSLRVPISEIPYYDTAISVDASCLGNPGLMEYRAVMVASKREIFRVGPYHDGTNNIGEFLAIVHALAMMKNHNLFVPIYTDSMNALAWIKGKKCKTKLARTQRNDVIFDLISRAELWLKNNTFDTPLLKWDTANWGEIPADFGRK